MESPDDRHYTPDHLWIKKDGDHLVIGVTHHAQETLGDVEHVDLPAVGASLSPGTTFGAVESTKAVSDLSTPMACTVTAVNETARETPTLVNDSPYEEGWLLRVTDFDHGDLDGLMNAAAYDDSL